MKFSIKRNGPGRVQHTVRPAFRFSFFIFHFSLPRV
jgi:hypothetical protein